MVYSVRATPNPLRRHAVLHWREGAEASRARLVQPLAIHFARSTARDIPQHLAVCSFELRALATMPPDEEVPEMAEASAAATATASRRVVTVYASSSSHIDRVFFEAAHELGMLIARRGWVQLNGGGRTGLMGAATDGGVQAGGAVDAVIPKMFHKVNESGNLRHVTVTEDMRDRKQGLLDRCEAIICLPGGLGTLEEAFEALSWRQLGLHNKPLVFLNVAGFYSGLETFLRSTQEAGFISERMKDAYMFCESPAEAIDFIENHEPAVVAKSDLHTIHSGGMLGHIRELQSDWEVAAQTSERLSQHAETSRK